MDDLDNEMWQELRKTTREPNDYDCQEQPEEDTVYFGQTVVGQMTLKSWDEGFHAGRSEGFRAGYNQGWAAHAVKVHREQQTDRKHVPSLLVTSLIALAIAGIGLIAALEVL